MTDIRRRKFNTLHSDSVIASASAGLNAGDCFLAHRVSLC
jgi:hypothetical protein